MLKMDVGLFFLPVIPILSIGIALFLLVVWQSYSKQSYWKNKGIPYTKPVPIVGSILENIRYPFHEVEQKRYNTLGPVYGYFEGDKPVISVGDPQLLRNVLVKDFSYFVNRRDTSVGDEVLDKMMSIVQGEDWKRIRTIVSPTFSTGKLKKMLSIFKNSARTLVKNFKKAAAIGEPINAKKLYGALAMDVIASSAFSTKIDSFNDPDNKFVVMAKNAFPTNFNWRFVMYFLLPSVMNYFRIPLFDKEVVNFFSVLTLQIIEERKKTGEIRNDFLQLMVNTAEEVAKEEKWDEIDKENDVTNNYGEEISDQKVFKTSQESSRLSMNELVAQCVLFFLAGYDTTSSTLSFASYSLALNEDVQGKARQEINKCLKETNGELTYEALQKMKYLDNVISETLRLYPPGFRLERQVETNYKLGDTGITLPKGMVVTASTHAIHRDPKHYPNPEKFDPNRFTPEERAKRHPYAYLPFGAGPRNCIGMRFALLEIKMALAHVISNFNIKTCPQTQIPIEIVVGLGLLQPKSCYLIMEPRQDSPLIK